MRLLLLLLFAVPVYAADDPLPDLQRLFDYDAKLEKLHEQELRELHNVNKELQRKIDALTGRSVCT